MIDDSINNLDQFYEFIKDTLTHLSSTEVQVTHSDWSGEQKLRTLVQKMHLNLVAVAGGPGSHLYLTF